MSGFLPDEIELPPTAVQIMWDTERCAWMFVAVKPQMFNVTNAPLEVIEAYKDEFGREPDLDVPLVCLQQHGTLYSSLEECAEVLPKLWAWFTGFSEFPTTEELSQ